MTRSTCASAAATRRSSVPLRGAVAERRRVRISYYAYGRDEHTARVVEPHRLYSDRGQLYLWAHCRDAGAERSFRVDRIEDVSVLDETFDAPEAPAGTARPPLVLRARHRAPDHLGPRARGRLGDRAVSDRVPGGSG